MIAVLLLLLACGRSPSSPSSPPPLRAAADTGLDEVQDTADPLEPVDADGDGVPAAFDCDDEDAARSPSLPELCDELDNDCDGEIDEGGPPGGDLDGDGYGPCQGDCDETDATVNPNHHDVCDGVDNDCDGLLDEDCEGGGE